MVLSLVAVIEHTYGAEQKTKGKQPASKPAAGRRQKTPNIFETAIKLQLHREKAPIPKPLDPEREARWNALMAQERITVIPA